MVVRTWRVGKSRFRVVGGKPNLAGLSRRATARDDMSSASVKEEAAVISKSEGAKRECL